ncbi:MAG: hypothetical protein E7604_13950 [Ruminococcaceae bacterium]|nr:hypothetical protein [Oscillospiraceae bacterium]
MITLKKTPGKPFLVLNLSDPQLGDGEWTEGHRNRRILETTVKTLIERVKPDLITVSGDLSWAGNDYAYDMLADFLDTFAIPWAPVWGNHDNQGGPEYIDSVADRYLTHKYCVYEKGDPTIGNGNYVIAVEENGCVVSGILMIDSHDRDPYTDADGNEQLAWARLTEPQMTWYKEQIAALRAMGCGDTSIIMHIPFYAYNNAYRAAYAKSDEESRKQLTPETAVPGADCWNPGYEDSLGVQYEGIGSYVTDDGVFEIIRDTGSTRHVIVGHDHINNWMINYQGVKLVFSLKAGAGCYWTPVLNGGTVLQIGSDGAECVYHEFVDVSDILAEG